MDVAAAHTKFLRRNAPTITCALCSTHLTATTQVAYLKHLRQQHTDVVESAGSQTQLDQVVDELFQKSNQKKAEPRQPEVKEETDVAPEAASTHTLASAYKRESPTPSVSPSKRVKGSENEPDTEFHPASRGNGKLFDPAADTRRAAQPAPGRAIRSPAVTPTRPRRGGHRSHGATKSSPAPDAVERVVDPPMGLIATPETKPISADQLVLETRGIYSGLIMIEAKAIEVDTAQAAEANSSDPPPKLKNDKWQALNALHRTLLYEHHDFLLATQHPSASPSLKRLPSKYAMPARMWRHGIHSYLEVLRHRLPGSLEHMLAFIYQAYAMIALLYETVKAFEGTWIECLGDLGRYRMAIEDDDIRDRETWSQVSRHWYSLASDKAPTVGRLYHHLAILARPNAVLQLSYYCKSLCVPIEFESTRDSIRTLFDPIMDTTSMLHSRLPQFEKSFVQFHAKLFDHADKAEIEARAVDCLDKCDAYVGRITRRILDTGHHIAITNCCAIMGYGHSSNALIRTAKPDMKATKETGEKAITIDQQMEYALDFTNRLHAILLRRITDPNALPYLHVTLCFMLFCAKTPELIKHVAPDFPWGLLATGLNTLTISYKSFDRLREAKYPRSGDDKSGETTKLRPLPEDWALRELPFADDDHFPKGYFLDNELHEDEKLFELPFMWEQRREVCLWLACHLAKLVENLNYDQVTHRFSAPQDSQDVVMEIMTEQQVAIDDKVDDRTLTASASSANPIKQPSLVRDLEELPDADPSSLVSEQPSEPATS